VGFLSSTTKYSDISQQHNLPFETFENTTFGYTHLAASLEMASAVKRIVFTGGSGKAGRHVIPELLKRGHKVGVSGSSAWTMQY